MRKINVGFSNGVYTFHFEHKELTFTLTLEEVAGLDAVISTLNKTGVLVKEPVITYGLFTIDIDQLFKKIDELFPDYKGKQQPVVTKLNEGTRYL